MKFPLLILAFATSVLAVQTSHFVHTSEADFKNGTMQNVVATNLGDLKLSLQAGQDDSRRGSERSAAPSYNARRSTRWQRSEAAGTGPQCE